MSATVLCTGGAGYVGSHTVAELLTSGYNVIVIDNFCNARKSEETKPASLIALEKHSGKTIGFYEADLRDRASIDRVFDENKIDCVIHFAALKAVGESCLIPLEYYKNNLTGTLNLIEAMRDHNVKKLVFSSSAMVYGEIVYLPLDEKHPTGRCTNPYGKSKYFIEEILKDLSVVPNGGWGFMILRYFNPVGAHPSGIIGEDPQGFPNNLMPYISEVAAGQRPELQVFGNDYDTRDGTGIRDYIHVMDLATGHVAALKKLLSDQFTGCNIYNLGTGEGSTVLEVIQAFETATGKKIPYRIVGRRPGDVTILQAAVKLAEEELGWKTQLNLEDMCRDTWKWIQNSRNIS